MTIEQSEPGADAEHRRALIRDALRYSCIAGALACAGIALSGATGLAISVALGTGLGVLNFILLARGVSAAVEQTVSAAQKARRERAEGSREVEPEEIPDRPRGTGGILRLGLVVLVLVAMVLFAPIDPIGLAVGVILVLVAASVSAFRLERAR